MRVKIWKKIEISAIFSYLFLHIQVLLVEILLLLLIIITIIFVIIIIIICFRAHSKTAYAPKGGQGWQEVL